MVFINDIKQRIDYAIKKKIDNISWGDIHRLIKDGCIMLNNKICKKKSTVVLPNDIVNIDDNIFDNVVLLDKDVHIEIKIIYQDDDMVVIDKPFDLSVYAKKAEESMIDILQYQLKTKLFLVHRLDKNTTGLMVLAKNLETHNWLQTLFKNRKINKKYYAMCVSLNPKINGYIEATLQNIHSLKKVKITSNAKSKYALTYFNLLKSKKNIHLYDIQIFTGRTHQIRVHMSSIGLLILGDEIYGDKKINKKYNIFTQQLQSYHLSFDLNNKHYDFTIPCQFHKYFF